MAGTGWDPAGIDASVTISEDGQTATRVGSHTYSSVRGLAGRSRGRRYFEITPDSSYLYDGNCMAGFVDANASLGVSLGAGSPISGGWRPSQGAFLYSYPSGSGTRADQDNVSAGVLGVLIDFDTKVCTIYRDGAIDWVEVMDIPNDTILFPAVSLYHDNAVTLQTVEPFQYPPEVTFMAWDIPDSAIVSKVSGLMKIEGEPVSRMLKAFTYERLIYRVNDQTITESKPLGQTISDENGEYQIILRDGFPRDVFVVAFDDYGEAFQPGTPVTPGYRIHPTIPNGLVYECDGAGVLPAEEPLWSTNTEESQLVGTASFAAVPFYRPEVNGPIKPTVSEMDPDPYWGYVKVLLNMAGPVGSSIITDATGIRNWSSHGYVSLQEVAEGRAATFVAPGAYIQTPHAIDLNLGNYDFCIEGYAKLENLTGPQVLIEKRSSGFSIGDWAIFAEPGGFSVNVRDISASAPPLNPAAVPALLGRFHWAWTRHGSTMRFFLNGALVASVTTYVTIQNTTEPLVIGRDSVSGGRFWLNGNVYGARVTIGVPRYTEPFTPPALPFPEFGS